MTNLIFVFFTQYKFYLLFLFCSLFILSCESPVVPDYSNPRDPKSPAFEPLTPTGLIMINHSDTKRTLFWKDNSKYESGYRIELRLGPERELKYAAEVPPNTTLFVDTTVVNTDTTYYYYLSGINSYGGTGFIDTLRFKIEFLKPSELRIHPLTKNSIKLAWADFNHFEDGYTVEQSEDKINFREITRTPANGYFCNVEGLDTSRDYYFRVKPFNKYNTGKYSDIIKVAYIPVVSRSEHLGFYYGGWNFVQLNYDGGYMIFGGIFILGNHYGEIHLFDLFNKTDKVFYKTEHGTDVECAAVSRNNELLVTVSNDEYIKVWNIKENKLQNEFVKPAQVNGIVFDITGTKITGICADGVIRCWSIDGNILFTTATIFNTKTRIAMSDDGNTIVAAGGNEFSVINSYDGSLVYSVNTDEEIREFRLGENNLAILHGNLIRVYDIAARIYKYDIPVINKPASFTFNKTGDLLISLNLINNHYVNSVWRMKDGQHVSYQESEFEYEMYFCKANNLIISFNASQGILSKQINYGWKQVDW